MEAIQKCVFQMLNSNEYDIWFECNKMMSFFDHFIFASIRSSLLQLKEWKPDIIEH